MSEISVIAGTSSGELAKKIARKLRAKLVKARTIAFPDGESKITLDKIPSNKKIVVVQSICPPVDTNLVHALSLIAKAKDMARHVTVVIPYMGYARQDREFLQGEIVTAKVLAKLIIAAGASEIIIVDIHSKIGLEHFEIKTTHVTAMPELVKYFKKMNLKNALVVSPDQGGEERAKIFANNLETNYIALEKNRDRKTGKVNIKTKDAKVRNMNIILVDDMISTGGSIIEAAKFLKKGGCAKIFATCTHGLLIGDAEKKITMAGIAEIVSTNTIPGNGIRVDVSGAIAKMIN